MNIFSVSQPTQNKIDEARDAQLEIIQEMLDHPENDQENLHLLFIMNEEEKRLEAEEINKNFLQNYPRWYLVFNGYLNAESDLERERAGLIYSEFQSIPAIKNETLSQKITRFTQLKIFNGG